MATTSGTSNSLVLLTDAPQFISRAFEGLRHGFDPRDELGLRLGFVDVVQRYLCAVMAAECIGLELTPPPDLRKLVKKLRTPSLGDWGRAACSTGEMLAECPPDALSAPGIVSLFAPRSDGPALRTLLKRFVELRNDDVAHRKGAQVVPASDAARLLAETSEWFADLCSRLRVLREYPLLYVHRAHQEAGRTLLDAYRFSGLNHQHLPEMSTSGPVPDGQVPFLLRPDGGVLYLAPWITVGQHESNGRYHARLLYSWKEGPRYSAVDGSNETVGEPAHGRWSLGSLVGKEYGAVQQTDLLAIPAAYVRPPNALHPSLAETLGADDSIRLDQAPTPPEGYRFERHLGAGGMGRVFLAVQADRPEERVALKVMREDVATNPSFRRRFKREIEVIRRLGGSHPGLTQFFDAGLEPSPWFAMRYVGGGSLAGHGARFSPDETFAIARNVLELLVKAHAAGIVHRDIKPSNVLLDELGCAHLVDWGIAAASWDAGRRITGSIDALGTYEFAAPEQLRPGSVDVTARADLYSVGRLIEFMLTRRVAGPGEVVDGLPAAFEAVVRKAVHVDPDSRFATAREMLTALYRREASGWTDGPPFEPGELVCGGSFRLVETRESDGPGWKFFAVDTVTGSPCQLVAARLGSDDADRLTWALREDPSVGNAVKSGGFLWVAQRRSAEAGTSERREAAARERAEEAARGGGPRRVEPQPEPDEGHAGSSGSRHDPDGGGNQEGMSMAEASALWARHLAEGTAHLDRSLKEARRRAAAGKPKAGWPDPPAKQARGARNPPSAGHKPEPRAQRPRRSSSSGADGNETRRAEQRRRSPRPGAPNAPLAPKARKTSLAGGAARFLSAVLAPPGLKLGITGTAALLTGVAAYAFSQRGNDKPTDDELRGVLELQYRALLVLNLRLRANEGLTRDQWLQECPPSIAQAMAMVFRFGHAIRGPLDGLGTTVTDDVRTADQLREALASGQKPSEQTRRWARQQLPVLAEAIDGLLGLSGDHGVPGLLGHKGGTLYVLGRHEGGFAYLALDKSATVHPAK